MPHHLLPPNGHVRGQVQVLVHPRGSALELLRAFGAAAQVSNPSVSPASVGDVTPKNLALQGRVPVRTTRGSRRMAGGYAELSDSGSQGTVRAVAPSEAAHTQRRTFGYGMTVWEGLGRRLIDPARHPQWRLTVGPIKSWWLVLHIVLDLLVLQSPPGLRPARRERGPQPGGPAPAGDSPP
jgi:hypothetical protein